MHDVCHFELPRSFRTQPMHDAARLKCRTYPYFIFHVMEYRQVSVATLVTWRRFIHIKKVYPPLSNKSNSPVWLKDIKLLLQNVSHNLTIWSSQRNLESETFGQILALNEYQFFIFTLSKLSKLLNLWNTIGILQIHYLWKIEEVFKFKVDL